MLTGLHCCVTIGSDEPVERPSFFDLFDTPVKPDAVGKGRKAGDEEEKDEDNEEEEGSENNEFGSPAALVPWHLCCTE